MELTPGKNIPSHPIVVYHPYTWDNYSQCNNNKYILLLLNFQERHISLSVFSPRKIPYLFKLYETAGGDIIKAKEKNYAKGRTSLIVD